MGIVYVFLAVVTMVISCTAKKNFNKNCSLFFSFCCIGFADLVFIALSGFKLDFNISVLPYALFLALSYSLATLFIIYSYKFGSFSFSSLVISYSLILPTLYGIILLNESTGICFYIGLILLVIATFLITYKNENKKVSPESEEITAVDDTTPIKEITLKDKKPLFGRLNGKWLLCIAVAFVANGFCSVFQTAEQIALNQAYKNELMIIALTVSAVFFFLLSLFIEKNKIKTAFKDSLKYGSLSGVMNGFSNMFVLYSVNKLNVSLVFPLISGGGLVLSFLYARFIYKEKYTIVQYVGFIISVASVVLLNV